MSFLAPTEQDHGNIPLPWFSLLLAGLLGIGYALFGAAPVDLVWNRSEIIAGDNGRWLTGHLVHTDSYHLLWNIGAYLILGIALESRFNVGLKRQIALILISTTLINAKLLWA